MKKRWRITCLLIIVLLTGTALLLYPTVSSAWNRAHQGRVIADYLEQRKATDDSRDEQLLAEARSYNQRLARLGGGFELSGEARSEFLSMLGADGGAVGYLEIPGIGLRLPVYLGTDEAVLQMGAGVLEGSSLPVGGADTHTVITGHCGLPNATLFTHLDRLTIGDEVVLYVLGETMYYEVSAVEIVSPYEMEALSVRSGEDLCTLVTCTPYGINSHRLLVRCRRQPEKEQDGGYARWEEEIQDEKTPKAIG